MTDMMPHYCSACGQPHGTDTAKNPEVEIARINAARDVRVAEMNRGEFKATSDELETQVQVAEIEADAQVGSAEALADAVAATAADEPAEAEPAVIEVEGEEEGELAEAEPPETSASPVPREPKKLTHWGAYR